MRYQPVDSGVAHPTMAIKTRDTDDRLPTTGPATGRYERYGYLATDEGDVIYDTTATDAWIRAERSAALDEWR